MIRCNVHRHCLWREQRDWTSEMRAEDIVLSSRLSGLVPGKSGEELLSRQNYVNSNRSLQEFVAESSGGAKVRELSMVEQPQDRIKSFEGVLWPCSEERCEAARDCGMRISLTRRLVCLP